MQNPLNDDELYVLARTLFPIFRSITGEGIRESAALIGEHISLRKHSIATGTRVFDWKIPQEWAVRSGQLRRARDGKVLIDIRDNPLHLLNFSEPFSGEVGLEELLSHLHTSDSRPDAIPYVTSYYEGRWGFCVTEDFRKSLGAEVYEVSIDVEKNNGKLNYWTGFLPASRPTNKTVLLSTYLCHPNLGNNELSGPIALVALIKMLKARSRRFNYLYYVGPETIGALAFLRKIPRALLGFLVGGIVLTCLGGPNQQIRFKHSRKWGLGEKPLFDRTAELFAARAATEFCTGSFDPAEGSDERQYCSPGLNLPVIQAARTPYGTYSEYHTSADDFDYMNFAHVLQSAEHLDTFLRFAELSGDRPRARVNKGEPFLSSRGLYPTLNVGGKRVRESSSLPNLRRFVSLADGSMDFSQLVSRLQLSPREALEIVEALVKAGLLSARWSKAAR